MHRLSLLLVLVLVGCTTSPAVTQYKTETVICPPRIPPVQCDDAWPERPIKDLVDLSKDRVRGRSAYACRGKMLEARDAAWSACKKELTP